MSDPSADELVPAREGPSKVIAFLAYSALIAVALVVIFALTSVGRLLDRWI